MIMSTIDKIFDKKDKKKFHKKQINMIFSSKKIIIFIHLHIDLLLQSYQLNHQIITK